MPDFYTILQKTPFPGHFEPMPRWQLQTAEYDLQLASRYYHERAARLGSLLLYTLPDAERIVDYWRGRYPSAEFMLLAYVEATQP